MRNGSVPVNSGAMNAIGKEQSLKAALGSTNSEFRQPDADLLARLFGSAEPTPEERQFRRYAQELGLPSQLPRDRTTPLFKVSNHDIGDLKQLPRKQTHSGKFNLVGLKNDGLPKRLWDSHANRTIEDPTVYQLQNYIAVSWTWGRYQSDVESIPGRKQFRKKHGTRWQVPFDDKGARRQNLLRCLTTALQKIKHYRYFWVDVLCIDQSDSEDNKDKEREIAKQANIFGQAKGVIAFLWTMDQQIVLANALTSFGNLLAWSFQFGKYRDEMIVHEESKRSSVSILPSDFERLRGDNWFTSLWALQEIVLFPEAIWMTQDGGYCKVNDRPMTTRLFAIAIRLLSWMAQQRESQWFQTEKCYLEWNNISPEAFTQIKETYESEENQLREAVRQGFVNHSMSYQAAGPSPGELVVETKRLRDQPPWIIACYRREKSYRDEIRQWTDWAFGTASIDVAISASRTAILLAAHNRDVVHGQPREQALAAALKIQVLPKMKTLWANVASRPHFSTDLLNLILAVEGLQIFNVAHASPQPSATRQDANLSDVTEYQEVDFEVEYIHILPKAYKLHESNGQPRICHWDLLEIKSEKCNLVVEYPQRGHPQYVEVLSGPSRSLTSMSPCTASRINPQVLHFAERDSYEWEPSRLWHMHDGGILHIPHQAQIQLITKQDNGTRLLFRANGLSTDYKIWTLSDLKLVLRTQPWLKETLGTKTKFLFVMLGVRNVKATERLKDTSASLLEKPEIIGIVLVGHESLEMNTPMTRWHKFGTYRGWGPCCRLMYKQGILVSSYTDSKDPKVESLSDCQLLRQSVKDIFASLSEHADAEDTEGFEVIWHSDVFSPSVSP